MDRALKPSSGAPSAVTVRAWRLWQALGWPGAIGTVLLAASAWLPWSARPLTSDTAHAAEPPLHSQAMQPAPARHPPAIQMPAQADVPLLLSRMERAAVGHGLGWPRADYRVLPGTDDKPAMLDVRVQLEGPYKSVRGFVTTLLLDTPTLTLQEFSLRRAHAEAPTVEARLAIVVYLATAAAAKSTGAPAR